LDPWLEARPHLAELARGLQSVLELAVELYERGRASGETVDYAVFEERVANATAEIERGVHQVALRGLDVDAPYIRVWGRHYRRVHRVARTYASLAGPVTVERTLYRERGCRQAPVLDPIATRAGVVDGSWLPRAARAVAHLVAQVTSREACATSREPMRLPYSRCSIERVGHAVGAEYLRRREQVEPQLIEAYEIPDGARSISVSIDRTTVAMEEPVTERPAPTTPLIKPSKEALREHARELSPRTRAVLNEALLESLRPRPKIMRNYRMAYCATVTLHDERGDALHTIRYGRMPPEAGSIESYTHRDVHRLMDRVRDDVLALRRRAGPMPVILLADGAPELWRLFSEHLNAETLGVVPVELIDAWHALEYIAGAARLLESKQKVWPGAFRLWKTWLLLEPRGAARVLAALEGAGMHTARDESGRRPVGDALRYLRARLSRMDYAEARKNGLPIGSGAVEATCKSLVGVRMKRPGARWKHKTGNEILQLRALQLSDRWDAAMPRVLSSLRKRVHVATRSEAYGRAA